MLYKTIALIAFLIFVAFSAKTQTNDFEVIETVKADTGTKIVYLTAVWCKPCMEKLDTIIKSFGGNNGSQLILLFDRYGYQQVYDKLKMLWDSSFFRLIPGRYYDAQSKGIINIKINPSKRVMKMFNDELSKYLSQKITLDDLWFGQALYIHNKKLTILKETGKEELIAALKTAINR